MIKNDAKITLAILQSITNFTKHDAGFTAFFSFLPDFIGFDGHFPGKPILPAMVQLMAGHVACCQAHARTLKVIKIGKAKFVKPVLPNQEIELKGLLAEKARTPAYTIQLFHKGEVVSSFQIELAE